ncbi:hypothetical protein GOBAR_AA17812 [Gossypium barbadense]|uniref:Hydrophobic seed protein domain-containing protein n=1 Tax=Gossypium barbadense TaxID=3634 RepID=A0A2P5XHT0_GOSBA|nr:hypothetical protein GOBAR_AA17812 [Gossypium barbadense]
MAFKIKASTALFFSFNLLFFTSVNSYNIDDYSKDSKNPVFIRPGDVYSNNQDQLASFRFWEVGCWRILLAGMGNLEAAVWLCTAMKVEMLGLPIDLNIALRAELSFCGREGAPEYNCSA